MQRRLYFVLGCLMLLLSDPLLAQKEGAIWYFGANAGLDFNMYYPKPVTDGKINTREGVATICDKNGKLLFYTDGQTVYNSAHLIMENGADLMGDVSSTQSSIVVPRPGNATQYYIFTVDQAGTPAMPGDGIRYTIVDMQYNLGLGKVLDKNQPLPNTGNILFTEKITVVKKDDKTYWIVTHEFGTNRFFLFKLTQDGLTATEPISAGTVHRFDRGSERGNRGATGYLKSSPKGEFLVSAVELLGSFELFSFNIQTGDIRLIAKLPAGTSARPQDTTRAAYGAEFSPTSNYLYGSTRKDGILYQWNLTRPDQQSIQSSTKILRENVEGLCGALQLAFNGKIYVSLGGRPYLGVINSPIQEQCNYREQGASLVDNSTGAGGAAYFGLPTFLSDFFKSAEFYYENTCYRDKTLFYPSTRIAVEGPPEWNVYTKSGSFVATFKGDNETWNGTYTFPAPGDYVVRMRINQYGSIQEYPRDITINPLPELNLPDTSNMCKGSPARLDAGDGAFYQWRDAPNLTVERFHNVYSQGTYFVTVQHYNGCFASDSTYVTEKPVPLIRDTVVIFAACGSSTGSITFEMEKPLDKYAFDWKDFPDNKTNQASGLAFGVYDVTITELETGCSILRKISISENNAPKVIIRKSVSGPVCAGTKITLTAEGALNFEWDNPAGLTDVSTDVFPWETTTYRVKGFTVDAGSGKECSSFGEVTVEVLPYILPQLGLPREGCQGDTIKLDGGSGFTAWNWSSGETSRYVNITQSYPELILVATDQNKCLLSDTISIHIKPLPLVNLPADTVQCEGIPLELYGGPGDKWLWNTRDTTDRIFAMQSGTYKLTITTNGCSASDETDVTIKPLPAVSLGNDTTRCLVEPIRLYGGRGDSYLWSTGETTAEIHAVASGLFWISITFDGCQNSDTVNLTVKPLPEVDLGRDSTYCKSNPIRLSGGSGDSYLWSTGASTQSINVNETGNYILKITLDGCENSDTVKIRVNDPALLRIDSVSQYPVTCPGNRDGSLRIWKSGSGLDYEYSIDGGQSWYDSPWFQGLYGDNTFRVAVREDRACQVTYNQDIVFEEPDSIRIKYRMVSPSCETCPDGEISLSIRGGTPPYSVLWSTRDTVTYLSDMVLGKYIVWVTDNNNCRENMLIDLTLDHPPFQVPNAFTPNGDGYNETWVIASLEDYPECEIKVLNSAGKLIWWSDTGYTTPWDGRDKTGTPMPAGSYYYLIWLHSSLKPVKGSVSIIR